MRGKKILITGAKGMLGREILPILSSRDCDVICVDVEDFDLTKEDEVKDFIISKRPEIIIHAGAYTNVNDAEKNPHLSHSVNVHGTRYIVSSAEKIGADIVYISTDFIFDGEKESAYIETDKPNPINVYGRTKYLGELEVVSYSGNWLIIRSAWLFGASSKCFPVRIYNRAITNGYLKLVIDEIGSPTYTKDLAMAIANLINVNAKGVFHFVNSGRASRYDIAVKTLEYFGLNDVKIYKIMADEFETIVKRPRMTVLDISKYVKLIERPRSWEKALYSFFNDYDISKL
ncbi:MAG: dTDP-4-dehydrorhamnose reductase [bacterium]